MTRPLLAAMVAAISFAAADANAGLGRELVATAELNNLHACNGALEAHQGMLNSVNGAKNTFLITDGKGDMGRYLLIASGNRGAVPTTQSVMVAADAEGKCASSAVTMGVFDANCEAVIQHSSPAGRRYDLEGVATFHQDGLFVATTYLPAGAKCVVITSGSLQTPKAIPGGVR